MSETFEELYAKQLKDVFKTQAQQQIEQGADALSSSRAYAEQGKPEFTLAFLLFIDLPEDEKRELFARSYECRAALSEKKAQQLDIQFHRSFPLIKLDAQKDRQVARSIRQGKSLRSTLLARLRFAVQSLLPALRSPLPHPQCHFARPFFYHSLSLQLPRNRHLLDSSSVRPG